jgi:hypothetical protein
MVFNPTATQGDTMKKKITSRKKTAPKSRQSADMKLATLTPREQMHQLFHGRQNDGGFFEYHLRQLATWRRIHEQREKPFWQKQIGVMKNGQAIDSRSQAEQNAEFLQMELDHLAANCRAALENWQPETFEHIAAMMRKIKSEDEQASHFNPFKTYCGMDYKKYLRAVILAASKQGVVNQYLLACELEKVNPNRNKQNEVDYRRVQSTRKNIGDICKQHKIPSKIGRPKVEN